MNRVPTLALAGAGTLGLMLIALVVYPSVYAYYIYPQTTTVLSPMWLVSKQEIEQENASFVIIHITDEQLSQYPQIGEGIRYIQEYAKNSLEGIETDPSSYPHISIHCNQVLEGMEICSPMIPLKISDIPKIADLSGVKADFRKGALMYIEYHSQYYLLLIAQPPEARSVYNNSLLYGIAISVVGSVAIWLVWAKIEARRNRQEDEEKIA